MHHKPETPQSLLDQLSEIQDEAEKNKVELTPEIREYIRTHLEAVQQKLANREEVTEDDLKFIQDVRLWVSLPDNVRKLFTNIEKMNKEIANEVYKRGISPKQWFDLLHVAESANQDKLWIDENFIFPGGGIIETEFNLELEDCKSLTSLPTNLTVNGNLNLKGATALRSLPDNLKVNGSLRLNNCVHLVSLPNSLKVGGAIILDYCHSLTLPDNLHVDGFLGLNYCTSLTSLPNNLIVDESLWLAHCTSLTSLPSDLKVGKHLFLTNDLHEQVKKDAERLKKEGRIKGDVDYIS